MNLFTIAGIVGILVVLFGVALAAIFVRLSQMVTENQLSLEQEQSALNPAMTFGFEIPVSADVPEQLTTARKLAAKRAAALPRGANMRIGRLGTPTTKGARHGLDEDPQSAVKIAAFHTWQGARTGPPIGGTEEQAAVAARQVQTAPTKKPEDLVPGEDYPFIEVTDDMGANEVRQARIANARARSAAIKALKQQIAASAPAEDVPASEPVVAEAQKASPASEAIAAANVPEPDYIEITDDMPPDEVRKARIHNARARSSYMKALKAAGVDPRQVTEREEHPGAAPAATEESAQAARPAEPTPASGREAEASVPAEPEAEPAPEAAAEAETIEIPAHIAEPDYVEITDDMSADEVRRARVNNARERSRYFKALKDAGIDPKKVADRQ